MQACPISYEAHTERLAENRVLPGAVDGAGFGSSLAKT